MKDLETGAPGLARYAMLAVACVLAGITGAAVAGLVRPDRSAEIRHLEQELGRLSDRIVTLQAAAAPGEGEDSEMRRLRLELANLKEEVRRLGPPPGQPGAPPTGELGEVAGAPSPPPAGTEEVADKALEERVREYVAEADRKRWETIGNSFAKMAEQRESSLLDSLAAEHGLSPYQRERMEEILARRREAIGAFFRTFLSGEEVAPDMNQIRTKMLDVQQETDDAAREILNQEQYDAYKELESATRRGPPWMGGAGPPRDR